MRTRRTQRRQPDPPEDGVRLCAGLLFPQIDRRQDADDRQRRRFRIVGHLGSSYQALYSFRME
jgi:hypothetical protein